MPQGDKTGPLGQGPRSGRGLGYCSGNKQAGYQSRETPARRGYGYGKAFGNGRGYGHGRGFGQGFGRHHDWESNAHYDENLNPINSPDNEKKFLEEEIAAMEARMKVMQDRLKSLDA